MSKSHYQHYGSKNSKQTDADGDWQGVPGVREMIEIKQQDHDDVFYHKQYVFRFSLGTSCILTAMSSRSQ